jgi:hypothetical protein
MTFEVAENAPERTRREVEKLHELAVNEFGYATEHVLFTAHGDGTISGRIALYAEADSHDHDENKDQDGRDSNVWMPGTQNNDYDPDPPGVGLQARVPSPSTGATNDSAEVGV